MPAVIKKRYSDGREEFVDQVNPGQNAVVGIQEATRHAGRVLLVECLPDDQASVLTVGRVSVRFFSRLLFFRADKQATFIREAPIGPICEADGPWLVNPADYIPDLSARTAAKDCSDLGIPYVTGYSTAQYNSLQPAE